ncbi:Aste57867_17386 [Aphanomyces stellatus]|uniref:Aste57867_17386 protein n=1 Tax=Aphanomyces stellatus TaxID=120398 RepID=A0A485L7L0_9STRA|nr:hypothetical protein As57867_017326 [Aphanomyces stellatus]VFT94142.1 Aste57867_17386 [Aphanomyces stellatus]
MWAVRRPAAAVRRGATRMHTQTAASIVDAELTAWSHRLPPNAGAALMSDGFFVFDNAVAPGLAAALRDEIEAIQGQLYANATHVYVSGRKDPLLLEKKHIHEMELLAVPPKEHPHLQRWFGNTTIRDTLNHVIPPLHAARHMIKVPSSILISLQRLVQVQYNQGDGGCFPMHFDTYGDDGKCLTAILYLNDAWRDGHGGELVLYPFPRPPIVVSPRFNRLVLFSSAQMLHRVLPRCLTTWLYKAGPSNIHAPPPPHSDDGYVRLVGKLCASPFRRHLAKLAYADAWKQSLVESHKDTDAFAAYISSFDAEIRAIDAATQKMLHGFNAKQPNAVPATTQAFLARLAAEFSRDEAASLVPWF